MGLTEDKILAAEKVLRFAYKYLGGNLDNLLSFSLSKLWNDDEFGCPGRERYDNDDTEIMRYIYVLVFSDLWPGLTLEALSNYAFRGDTLNTYNTMFGSPYKQYNTTKSKHPGLDKFNPTDKISKKAIEFRFSTYTHIGNMAVLPNLWLNDTTINRYRGCNDTHDFFDRFLIDLKHILLGNEKCDEDLLALINHNDIYFEPFRSADGFKKIVEGMFLEDYVDSDCNPIVVSKAYYFWMRKDGHDVTNEEYLAEANRHLDFSTKVIENRGRKMLEKLKKELLNIHQFND